MTDLTSRLRESIVADEWGADYNDHPVVRRSVRPVLPLSLYFDGPPYTKNDGFLGFFVYNHISNLRHLCVLLRKSDLCRCGCKGWCTLFVVMFFLHHCFESLAEGRFFQHRHDRAAWLDSDVFSASVAGDLMAVVGALLNIKGD